MECRPFFPSQAISQRNKQKRSLFSLTHLPLPADNVSGGKNKMIDVLLLPDVNTCKIFFLLSFFKKKNLACLFYCLLFNLFFNSALQNICSFLTFSLQGYVLDWSTWISFQRAVNPLKIFCGNTCMYKKVHDFYQIPKGVSPIRVGGQLT